MIPIDAADLRQVGIESLSGWPLRTGWALTAGQSLRAGCPRWPRITGRTYRPSRSRRAGWTLLSLPAAVTLQETLDHFR